MTVFFDVRGCKNRVIHVILMTLITKDNRAMTREEWLLKLSEKLEVLFSENNATLPSYRVTCSFPSKGGLSAKNRTIGQCWDSRASADQTHEVIVSITLDDPMKIAGVLAHELVHASVGVQHGHKAPFRKLALAIGLEGKMTATTESDAFKQRVQPWLNELGEYPHAKLDATNQKKQGTRLIKVQCSECEYNVRVVRKWLDVGNPICPTHNVAMEER